MRGRLRRLARAAKEGAVLIHQRDGTIRAFDRMHVMAEVYLAKLDAALGSPRRSSDVLDALDGATLESRRSVEEMCLSAFSPEISRREKLPSPSRTSPSRHERREDGF